MIKSFAFALGSLVVPSQLAGGLVVAPQRGVLNVEYVLCDFGGPVADLFAVGFHQLAARRVEPLQGVVRSSQRLPRLVAFDGDAGDVGAEVGQAVLPLVGRSRLVETEHERTDRFAVGVQDRFGVTGEHAVGDAEPAPLVRPSVVGFDVSRHPP